jgi:hypothetical protein
MSFTMAGDHLDAHLFAADVEGDDVLGLALHEGLDERLLLGELLLPLRELDRPQADGAVIHFHAPVRVVDKWFRFSTIRWDMPGE